MKEKIFSILPYLLLALFFVAVLAVNSKTHMTEPVFSLDLTENIPEITTDRELILPENSEIQSENQIPEEENNSGTQIIEDKDSENPCYYTQNGTKYHLDYECRYLKNSSKIIKTTIEFAKDLGLEPCSGCQD